VAGRFALGMPIKQQQKTLMLQLGIAREGEVIGDEALPAYLKFFNKPMTEESLVASLALFGWIPEVLPLAGDRRQKTKALRSSLLCVCRVDAIRL
jgi:hypothetical protein